MIHKIPTPAALLAILVLTACDAGGPEPGGGPGPEPRADGAAVRPDSVEIAAQPAANGDPAYWVENFRWSDKSGATRVIRLVNLYGDIRARSAKDGRVFLSAMIQKIGTRTDEFEFAIDEEEESLVIEVRPLVDNPAGRVDVAFLSPHGLTLALETRDGMIRTKRLASKIEATTQGGNIQLIDPASVRARSLDGSIQVQLAAERHESPLEIATRDGQVDVYLPAAVRLQFDVRSGGEVRPGFTAEAAADLVLARDGDSTTLRGTVGGGGTRLQIRSESGAVEIHPLM